MNRYMADFIAEEVGEGCPIHHLHGAGRNYAWLTGELGRRGVALTKGGDVEVREYIYDMPLVMAAADLVICRAGASTISELTAIAKPCILVPSPNVTNNHQEKNARVLEQHGAAVVLLEPEIDGKRLYGTAKELLADRDRLTAMSKSLNLVGLRRAGYSSDTIGRIKALYKALYMEGLTVAQAVEQMDTLIADAPEEVRPILAAMRDFVANNTRGIVRP